MDGLGGGLIGTAGSGDHGSVGGLAVKALRLLGGPHDDFERDAGITWLKKNIFFVKNFFLPHIKPRRRTAWIQLTKQVAFHKAHFVPCRLEVDGESKPDCPLFTATPRGKQPRKVLVDITRRKKSAERNANPCGVSSR